MKRIRTRTTYLEMRAPPARGAPAASVGGARVERFRPRSVEQYRELYDGVGRDYLWVDRNLMPDDELLRIVTDPQVEIHRLLVDGRPAGFAELDRRRPGEIELAYFGLFPAYLGRRLGTHFLGEVLRRAWSYGPKRVWVHTCDLDHPAALPTYLRAGFTIYDERLVDQLVPDSRDA